ncbi:hypothetical protein [Xanthomonas sp. GPE 39]|uniref:hypothetical protein n=1 Tax=Xanthomonas sp. GPE 39 TaxID=1583099 RepID=UPI0005F2BBA0|nr:hypothetical protein [Xanthomonas sp. GPE 39]
MDPGQVKAVKQHASDTALSQLLSAQRQVEQARSCYQALRALLPTTLIEAVRLTQGEQRAAEAGQQGRDAANGLIHQAERALQQVITALRVDHEAMVALIRQLNGAARDIQVPPPLSMVPVGDDDHGEDARRVVASLRGAIATEVAQAIDQQLQPLRAQVEALLAQMGAASPTPSRVTR